MDKEKRLIRFDWALKKILRKKANFVILEGFLSELLQEDITIIQILESETNQEDENDKHNRVDILVENSVSELIIIELQNSKEHDYFHRILYGTSKIITDYIEKGEKYDNVRKVISITIAYFDLGQGKDYVYHGRSHFKGIHQGDELMLSKIQMQDYQKQQAYQIFPEYWIIKVEQFDDAIKDKLDEWIYFLKNSKIKTGSSAKGLKEAKVTLDEIKMNKAEKLAYNRYRNRLRDIASYEDTILMDERMKIILMEKIEKGQAKLEKGTAELEKGTAELEKGTAELEKGTAELEKGTAELEKGTAELEKGTAELDESKSKLEQEKAKLDESKAKLDESESELKESKAKLEQEKNKLEQEKNKFEESKKEFEKKSLEKVKEQETIKLILAMDKQGIAIEQIAQITQIQEAQVRKIIQQSRTD